MSDSPAPPATPTPPTTARTPARVQVEIRGLERKPWRDVYPFLLWTAWPWLLLLIAVVYLGVNALFGVGYWLDRGGVENARPGSYADAFFFSIQTWATIGYGKMVPSSLTAHVLVTVESFLGMLSVALVTGLLFAKFSRPTARVLFSRVAVITTWEGKRSLLLRLANERGTQIVDAQLYVTINRMETSADGGSIRRYHDLQLTRSKNPSFMFAWTVIHHIDEHSPLHGLTSELLASQDTIIGVSLVGIDEVFNQTVYSRHAYSAQDLRWGHDFIPILSRGDRGQRIIDYSHFHDTEPEEARRRSTSRDDVTDRQHRSHHEAFLVLEIEGAEG